AEKEFGISFEKTSEDETIRTTVRNIPLPRTSDPATEYGDGLSSQQEFQAHIEIEYLKKGNKKGSVKFDGQTLTIEPKPTGKERAVPSGSPLSPTFHGFALAHFQSKITTAWDAFRFDEALRLYDRIFGDTSNRPAMELANQRPVSLSGRLIPRIFVPR